MEPRPRPRPPSVRWVKEWVPQEVVATGGKCLLLKWIREDKLKALREKSEEEEVKEEPKPEPKTEVIFLCSYENCGKTFIDVSALRKHAQTHGERQYVCHFDGCGKKFLDSSKLKRHFLIHTGERNFVCPHEGCHKAFSLDFNLRAHMKTHLPENYHVCPYPECGKRYTQENKLNSHIKAHHEKHATTEPTKQTPQAREKIRTAPKNSSATKINSNINSNSPNRPFSCPYEGCNKAYIHEYKLNLHLRKEHPDHNNSPQESNGKLSRPSPQEFVNNKKGKREKEDRTSGLELERESWPRKRAKKEDLNLDTDFVRPDINSTARDYQSEGEEEEEDSEETEDDEETEDED